MRKILKKHAEKVRFAVVGGANTAIDFAILFILVALGIPTIVSNLISTSLALVFSFFANKKFTFKNEVTNKTQFVYFLAITLFGLWIIQPLIIEGIKISLSALFLNNYFVLFAGKITATIVTLIWNYLLYKRFVFKK
ncbi:MAG: GtrA family protein [Candidatus Saccharibacteria bacterium]